jgi:predicted nucleic acid-binding protein
MSDALEAELADVLTRSDFLSHVRWTREQALGFILDLVDSSIFVEPQFLVHVLADESDNRLLEAAAAGDAKYIVSGDKPVRALGTYEGIEIISAARFIEILDAIAS